MAKQAETTAYKNVRSNPFTRVHGQPTQSDYEILKSEAGALASEVEDITYAWSKNNTDNYGLLGNILGEDEYNVLTGIGTYTIPTEPVSYDPTITNATFTHERVCVCVNLASTALGLSHDRPVKAQGRAPSAAKCCC
jgi:hypothetical protein